MTRWWRPRPERDGGMTMAEVLVSMTVFGMLMSATLVVTFQVQQLYVRDTAREDAMAAARHVIDVAVRDVGGATDVTVSGTALSFSETTGTATTFYLLGPTGAMLKERIWLDAQNRLWKQTTQADASSVAPNYTFTTNLNQRTEQLASGVSTSTSIVVNGVATTAPLFSYDVAGTLSTNVTTNAQRADVDAVKVVVTVGTQTGSEAQPVTLINTVNPLANTLDTTS